MYTATFCVAYDSGGGAITAISTPVGFSTLVGTDHQVEFCHYQLCSYLHHFGQTACQSQHT